MTERAASRHVHELDVVRVLTFACVIGVHSLSHTTAAGNPLANGIEVLLHFTREAFFLLTGFVLMHQYGRRRYNVVRFWARRLWLVGVPYAAWSLLYTGLQHTGTPGEDLTGFLHHLGDNLMFGQAWYHLYFVLVSLQIYLLFPLIQWLVNATARHHAALLGVAAAVQAVVLGWQYYGPAPTGVLATLAPHQEALIWNYELWILMGAVGAYHLAGVRAWVAARRRAVAVAVPVAAAVALVWYALAVAGGQTPLSAADVLQPMMIIWGTAAVVGLFALGTLWDDRRAPGRLQSVLTYGSDRSYGIFLVHPMIIWFVVWVGDAWTLRHVPNPVLSIGTYLVAVAGSVAVTEVVRRSPLSLTLTGRHQLRHRPSTVAVETLNSTETVDPDPASLPAGRP